MDAATRTPRCWCGNPALADFSEAYAACLECGTLVSLRGLREREAEVRDDEHDFYGKPYWLAHQREDLGFPDIYERARLDLPERCLQWLRTLLAHRLPPARVLELGSGHGAFVALMRAAGFEATGLELSPWVVDFARTTFGVPMLLGPIEAQALPEDSLDVVVLNDVLEHLVEPRESMRRCAKLLAPDGFVVAQTPCYPDDQSYAQLVEANHPFLAMLQEREHLYLFSQRAARRLFADVGLPIVRFEPALFPYDMVVVASRHELTPTDPDRRQEILLASPPARLVRAMVDLDDRAREQARRVDEIESDRRDRIAMIERLNRHIEETSRDHEARQRVILDLQTAIESLERDRMERIAMIERLNHHIEQTSGDHEARQRVVLDQQAAIDGSQQEIARLTAESQARGQTVLEQQAAIDGLRREVARLTAESEARRQLIGMQATAMESLTQQATQLAGESEAQLRVIADQQATIEKLVQQKDHLAALEARVGVIEQGHLAMRRSRWARLLRALRLS